MKTLTARRTEGEFDLEMGIAALTEELSVYPEDVVKTVCRDWARNNKWFPALNDLIKECDGYMVARRALLNIKEEVSPELRLTHEDGQATQEDKDAVSKMIADCIASIGAAP